MHELSITQNVVEICEANAGGRHVTMVSLQIGKLSGIVPDAVEFCFDACTRGTLLEGARLIIEETPAVGKCVQCGEKYLMETLFSECPRCGGFGAELLSGNELRVKELEVE
jgi:hydrogenase nickel incorporation protein HypA/HybF